MSGDDMNIIQVGRPAVSRYHQIKGFYPPGETPNFTVHDFPNSEYGIKLGGFMIMGGTNLSGTSRPNYLDMLDVLEVNRQCPY